MVLQPNEIRKWCYPISTKKTYSNKNVLPLYLFTVQNK